jgi:Holliday junction DNA helicase RuvB
MISSPLRSRFSGGIFKLDFYTNAEIEKIIARSAEILGMELDGAAGEEIAKRSRFTPRTANYFLKRCRDFAQVNKSALTKNVVSETLKLLGIDEVGLSPADRDILHTVINKFGGGPVGLNTLAAALSEEQATIEEFNEPYLIQLGFLDRTPRGRVVTELGYKHLGLSAPANKEML